MLLATAAHASDPSGGFEPDGLIVIRAETLVLGPGGTRIEGQDRAVLAPGKTGLLRLEVRLAGAASIDGERERVSLQLRVTYTAKQPGAAAASASASASPIRLDVTSVARAVASGEVVIRSSGSELERPGSMLHEAFVSGASGERVVVNLRADPWVEEPGLIQNIAEGAPRPVQYQISIYRKTVAGLDFLGMPVLHSLVGRSAFYSFGFVLGDRSGTAEIREELRLEVRAVELRDERLAGTTTLSGTLRGTPVRASSSWALRSGEEATISLDLGEVGGEDLASVMVIAVSF